MHVVETYMRMLTAVFPIYTHTHIHSCYIRIYEVPRGFLLTPDKFFSSI